MLGSLLIAAISPPARDERTDCIRQCAPRRGELIADKNYPMSAKGSYRQVCQCQ
jgi:hypothetical protein